MADGQRALPTPEDKPPAPLRLSYSSISAFEECPYRYKLGRELFQPEDPDPDAERRMAVGILVHEALSLLTEWNQLGLHADMLAPQVLNLAMDTAVQQAGEKGRPLPEQAVPVARIMLGAWWRPDRVRDETVLFDGDELVERLMDNVEVRGYPDAIRWRRPAAKGKPGDYILVDYKTGRTDYGASKIEQSLQLRMYAWLWSRFLERDPSRHRHDGGGYRIRIRYEQVTQGTGVDCLLTQREIEQVAPRLREIAQRILTGERPPKPGPACRFCGYRKSCQYSVARGAVG